MVAKKGKSKRQSLSQKYKIQRKVREHHRKSKKEGGTGIAKNPGIPNLFPFKEKLLEELQQNRQNERTIEALAKQAQARSDSFQDQEIQQESTQIMQDNSKKSFYKDFKNVVNAADVILQVLDARDPIGTRSKQIEEMIIQCGAGKRIIMVLNKIDLVPREIVSSWLKFLRNEYPAVAFKANTQSQRSNLGQNKASIEKAFTSSECLGADSLMKLLKNYCRNMNIKTSITVGVVGFPNVGKSSLINSLKRSRVCSAGSTPGLTKVTQEIHLDKNIKLIDCPGIVFAKTKGLSDLEAAQVALRNCVKSENITDPILPVDLILQKCNHQQLQSLYSIPHFSSTNEFLIHVARQRGRIRKGGIPDLSAAAFSVLQDWNNGKIPYYTVPPTTAARVSSEIVSEYAKEFNLEDLNDDELKVTKKKEDMGIKMMVVDSEQVEVDMNGDLLPGYQNADEMSMECDSEDDVEDDLEDEEMDEEDAVLAQLVTMPIKKKTKAVIVEEKQEIMNAFEQEINPQLNQRRKKEMKAQKKKQKKGSSSENYDFGEFLGDVEM